MAKALALRDPNNADDSDGLLEMTEQYITELSDSLDEMRPVDRSAVASEQTASDLYSRLSDISPEHSAELALTVSEALPESSHVIAEAYLHNLIQSENKQHCATEAVENIENAVNNYISQVVDTIPEYAMDIASTIIDSIPKVASEMVELLQESEAIETNDLSVSIDDKPEQNG